MVVDQNIPQTIDSQYFAAGRSSMQKKIDSFKDTYRQPLNVLILYDINSIHISTVSEYLQAFANWSYHHIYFGCGTNFSRCNLDLSLFDVIVIHYSVRIKCNGSGGISKSFLNSIKKYDGYKVLIIQDEYESTNVAKRRIKELGINLVYTCVSDDYREKVYPTSEFPNVDFKQVLTGYVSSKLLQMQAKPLDSRIYWIGYRGRDLPYIYGDLGREKYEIGVKMKSICKERNIPCDIECDDSLRIYGDAWYDFLSNCRATLGTESGSNVFDFDGELANKINAAKQANPNINYETIYHSYLKEHDGVIIMNQISPKIFEAIALKTALILFEGSYSNVITPGVHYLTLKKDFSNIDSVLTALADDDYIKTMTDAAYNDIVASRKYSYQQFIADFDATLDSNIQIVSNSAKQLKRKLTNTRFRKKINSYLETYALATNIYEARPVISARLFLIRVVILFDKILPGRPIRKIYHFICNLRLKIKILTMYCKIE